MLKKLALPVVALLAVLMLASPPAKAGVHFGITVGPPVYTYPAYPYYNYPYYYNNPYVYSYTYPHGYNYYYPTPRYVYPFGHFDRGHARHEFREHERHERMEHQGHGDFHGRGRR